MDRTFYTLRTFRDLMPFRGFVAVPVPADPSLARLLDELGTLRADVKPVEPEQLHFTLSFLGWLPDEAKAPLSAALPRATEGIAAFDVHLATVGAFPNVRHPRVVWAGVEDPPPLVRLATRVRETLADAGYRGDDKDFRAHLTLARVKSPRGLPEVASFLRAHGHDDLITFRANEVRFYESTLSPKGPTYTTLATAPLEG